MKKDGFFKEKKRDQSKKRKPEEIEHEKVYQMNQVRAQRNNRSDQGGKTVGDAEVINQKTLSVPLQTAP